MEHWSFKAWEHGTLVAWVFGNLGPLDSESNYEDLLSFESLGLAIEGELRGRGGGLWVLMVGFCFGYSITSLLVPFSCLLTFILKTSQKMA